MATTDPHAGYKVSDTDTAADVKYYGYIDDSGKWYIMQETTSTGAFRYHTGTGAYADGWTGRAALTYGYWPS